MVDIDVVQKTNIIYEISHEHINVVSIRIPKLT